MKCSQMGCNDVVTHRIFWPNNPPHMVCREHARLTEGAARAIGLYVYIEEIPDDSSRESESNSQDSKG